MKTNILKGLTLIAIAIISFGIVAQNNDSDAMPGAKKGALPPLVHQPILHVREIQDDQEPPITGLIFFGGDINKNIDKIQVMLKDLKTVINTFNDKFNEWYAKKSVELTKLTNSSEDLKKLRQLYKWWHLHFGDFIQKVMKTLYEGTLGSEDEESADNLKAKKGG